MLSSEETILTERQVEVLRLRKQGNTQREVAEELGTTDSNVSAIERSAKDNVRKARKTLSLMRTLQSPVRFTVPEGTEFTTLVDEIYSQGDEVDVKISYCRPELHSHLYNKLKSDIEQNQLKTAVEIGLTENGDVETFINETAEDVVRPHSE